jgi:hypothetical protein
MNNVFDDALETKKFQMYAEKADTVEKRIELCEKYLKAKRKPTAPLPDVDRNPMQDSRGIHRVRYNYYMRDCDYAVMTSDMASHINKELVIGLVREMIHKGYVKFDKDTNMLEGTTVFNATAFIWKDPNKP